MINNTDYAFNVTEYEKVQKSMDTSSRYVLNMAVDCNSCLNVKKKENKFLVLGPLVLVTNSFNWLFLPWFSFFKWKQVNDRNLLKWIMIDFDMWEKDREVWDKRNGTLQ